MRYKNIFHYLNFHVLTLRSNDLQVNMDVAQIFTNDIFTILPSLFDSNIMLLCDAIVSIIERY